MRRILVEGRGNFEAWREHARALFLAGTPPEAVEWREAGQDEDLFAGQDANAEPSIDICPPASRRLTVPPAFLALAQSAICHSDPGRFALLYRLLWRLNHDRSLLEALADPDIVRVHNMEKSVRRDSHKMKAFVRFKEILGAGIRPGRNVQQGESGEGGTDGEWAQTCEDGGRPVRFENAAGGADMIADRLQPQLPASALGRRRFLAWFEPDHHIVGRTAPFFQRRFTDMDWIIVTPKGSASWNGETLVISDAVCEKPDLDDATDDLWKVYYANIFNPARLKIKAMQAEMPKKYWKNLPEASLIPGLIAEAEASVAAMAARAATTPLPFHQRLQAAAARVAPEPAKPAGTLEALREQARHCTRCALHCKATQTVFGEGPQNAAVMFVGEQPGDQEDLAGRPFVGPAGQVFNGVMQQVGFERSRAYVTNAVKHFKYEPRGKRRIHQKPNMGEVDHCRWWLKLELDLVRPKLVVAMGATALAALTETRQKLADVRGQVMPLSPDRVLFTTVHPSYLLRIPDEGLKREEMARFVADMARVRAIAETIGHPASAM
jgi:DNA polymerase